MQELDDELDESIDYDPTEDNKIVELTNMFNDLTGKNIDLGDVNTLIKLYKSLNN